MRRIVEYSHRTPQEAGGNRGRGSLQTSVNVTPAEVGQAMARRARVVLSCEQRMSNSEAAARRLQITGATVGKWRERFSELGLDGLLDERRVGAPRKVTDEKVEEVISKNLECVPANSTHWSVSLMSDETGLSQNAIVRIWHAFGLQPHRVENFRFSKEPAVLGESAGHLGLYLIHQIAPSSYVWMRRAKYRR